MSTAATPILSSLPSLRIRSLGVKFFLLAALALLLSRTSLLVEDLTRERATLHGVTSLSTETAQEQPKTVLGIRFVVFCARSKNDKSISVRGVPISTQVAENTATDG